jgi:hypothetical protein
MEGILGPDRTYDTQELKEQTLILSEKSSKTYKSPEEQTSGNILSYFGECDSIQKRMDLARQKLREQEEALERDKLV